MPGRSACHLRHHHRSAGRHLARLSIFTELGPFGVRAVTDPMGGREAALFARQIERWGYKAIWLHDASGHNILVQAGWLLANTEKAIVATGITNIYSRDAMALAAAQKDLAEQSGGRFLLGVGVSHPAIVAERGHATYEKPLTKTRNYLGQMSAAKYNSPLPEKRPKTIVGAYGPKMMELAAELTDGLVPVYTTPDHTAHAREILGPDKLLCVDHLVMLERDQTDARRKARHDLAFPLTMEALRASWRRQGFDDNDFENGGSDRLIDAIVAWGDEDQIRKRLQLHFDAGADHIVLHSIPWAHERRIRDSEKIFELFAPCQTR